MIKVFCAILATLAHAEVTKENGVIVLSESNFDEGVAAHEHILVEFYAPWCDHCKTLAPKYEEAAFELSKLGLPLAKVDAKSNSKLAERFEIDGYPMLKFFENGRYSSEYTGGYEVTDIVKWVQR